MDLPQQLTLDIQLDESVDLQNFISCQSTNLTLEALKNFIKTESLIKSLFLWGKVGSGKEYLLQAVNKRFIDDNLKTAYISFLDPGILKNPDVLIGLGSLDVVFIKDFQALPKDSNWEISLFNLINTCLLENTKLFFSSDIVAKDIEIKLPDLKSRILAFTAVEIPEITDEEKTKALFESATRKGIDLDQRTLRYILNHTSRSLSDLLRLLSELDAFSLEKKRKLTVPLVKELLANKSNNLHK